MRGITIANCSDPISVVPGTQIGNFTSLIMAGGNSEIIKYTWNKGVVGLFPTVEDANVIETYIVLNGSLTLEFRDKSTCILSKDNTLCLEYDSDPVSFKVNENVELLLVTNYHPYLPDTIRDSNLVDIMEKIQESDGDTLEHCNRVRNLSMEIGMISDIPYSEMRCLFYASRFHDVGKCRIPKDILIKPGKLDENEYGIMKNHSSFSAELVRPCFGNTIAHCVLCHHERIDGKGYPNGLIGDHIPENSKIISVADSFDAMITVRPYNKGKTPEEALAELHRCEGTQFEKKYVDALDSYLNESGLI